MKKTALPLLLITGLIITGCSSQPAAPTPEPPVKDTGTDAGTDTGAGTAAVPVMAEKYTIFFGEDGTLGINADCNVVGGTYVVRNNGTFVIETSGEYVGEGLNLLTDANATMQFTPVREIALGPNDISLEIQDLPYMWDAQVVRGTPYDDTKPPGPMGLPAHIQASFTPTDDTATEAPAPVMYIIPVEAYKALWDEAGNAAVSETTAQIFQYASVLPYPGPISGLPVLPFEQVGGTNDLAVQQGRVPANLARATRDGYRFVGRFAQDANPVTNQGLQYIYQGFTSDAEYLVAFFAPVRTDALVNSAGEVAQDEQDRLNADYSGYMQERAVMLNGLDSTTWQPDLATLDALVASLTINGMANNAAIGFVWNALSNNTVPGGEQTPIAEPYKSQR